MEGIPEGLRAGAVRVGTGKGPEWARQVGVGS